MPLESMTGFARGGREGARARFVWEARSVNGRGLDIRTRLPAGFDAIDAKARASVQAAFKRGSIQITLTLDRAGGEGRMRINEAALDQILLAMQRIADRVDAGAPTLDGILALKGVLEIEDAADESEEARAAFEVELLSSLGAVLAALKEARRAEGAALGRVLETELAAIESLCAAAAASPAAKAEALKARLKEQVTALLETGAALDPDRLAQEAALLAAKADIREEIDRLRAHVDQARALLAEGEAVGRRLDFLSQEFLREANTLCSKASAIELTRIGLELKAVIDQFREQVQNVE